MLQNKNAKPEKMAKDKKSASVKKPASKLSTVMKASGQKKETKTVQFGKMVADAFDRLKTKEGLSLRAIYDHISSTFGIEMDKNNHTMVKKIIGKGFREGRIAMTNHDSTKIDYTKRFEMVNLEMESTDENEE